MKTKILLIFILALFKGLIMAEEITSNNFEKEVEKSSIPVVVDVYASWCGPCRQMVPLFDELANEFKDKVKFVKLNIDEARELGIRFGVSSIPTFLFFKDGRLINKEVGSRSKESLKLLANNLIK